MKSVVVRMQVVELDDSDSASKFDQPQEREIYSSQFDIDQGYFDTDKVDIMKNTAFQRYDDYWTKLRAECTHDELEEVDSNEWMCEDCGEIVTPEGRDADDELKGIKELEQV